MKRYVLPLVFLACLCTLHAQNGYWEEAKGPYGGIVRVVPTLTNVVYAVHEYSMHRSEDYGEHWERIFVTEVDSMDDYKEELVIGNSGTFYKILVYTGEGNGVVRKLFTSSDEGLTWGLKNAALPFSQVFEVSSGVLLGVQQYGNLIFRSSNGGDTWQIVHTTQTFSLSNYCTLSNLFMEGKLLISSVYDQGFLYSDDLGVSWTEEEAPCTYASYNIASSGTIFAVSEFSSNPNLYRSVDAGATWNSIPINLRPDESLQNIVSLSNDKILLSSSYQLFSSIDDGLTWTAIVSTGDNSYGFPIQYPLPNGDLLGLNNLSLVRSSDQGSTWTFSAYNMHNGYITALKLFDEQHQLALSTSGLWKTTDRGETWSMLLADTSTTYVYGNHYFTAVNSTRFAVQMGRDIWASTNGGQSFENISPTGGVERGDIFMVPDGPLFCTTIEGVMRMNVLGDDWLPIIPDQFLYNFAVHPSGDFYALTIPPNFFSQAQTLWRSQDEGQTWATVNTLAIPAESRYDLHVSTTGVLYVTGFFDHAIQVAISENNAQDWTYRIIPEINTSGDIAANAHDHIFTPVSKQNLTIVTSTDAGESWYCLPEFPIEDIYYRQKVISPEGYLYVICSNGLLLRSSKSTESGAYIRGRVAKDADADCSTADAQEPMKNWVVTLEGENTFYGSTNAQGRYTFFVDTGQYSVRATVPQNPWWSLCDSAQSIDASDFFNSDTVDFAALALIDCPLMSVNVAAPMLRRCFDNQVVVAYCNQGTDMADSAWVDVMLDPYLNLVASAQPHEVQPNGLLRFFLGDVPSGDCGQFSLTVYVSCDSTVLGQTHCISAHAFPDTLCGILPGWSGADIVASVSCQDTTLQFTLQNTGLAPSQSLDYIIIEDDVVLFSGQKSYAPGESHTLDYPSNGSTWRIESEQEPGHPFSFLALAFAEGCGGFESLGFVNQFPVNGAAPAWHRLCLENIGAYDPNDKQGFPLGSGSGHDIRPGQSLDYLIRFQNTGTDTAFTVLIRDTLSALLDPTSIRPGAGSHAYTWNLNGEGVISFTFNNIALPDSNVNEPGSHGFVQFGIDPKPDVPLGSVIENSAAIYFDFNEPVITNTTWHTIQKSPLSVSTRPEPSAATTGLHLWPNPCVGHTNVRIEQAGSGPHTLRIFNSLGKTVRQKTTTGPDTQLITKDLPPGLYWVEASDAKGRPVGRGTFVKQGE